MSTLKIKQKEIAVGNKLVQEQSDKGLVITIGGKSSRSVYRSKVDIAFIFDTTGSMDNKIEALLNVCSSFVNEPAKFDLDAHFLLVSFGDLKVFGDRIELVTLLTPSIQKIKEGLKNIPRNGGGGNEGESSLEAIKFGLAQKYRPNSVKVMLLITDEPAHQDTISTKVIKNEITRNGVLFYALTPRLSYFIEMAKENGGEWQEISIDSNLKMVEGLFRRLAERVATVVKDVHKLSGGSVPKYLLEGKTQS